MRPVRKDELRLCLLATSGELSFPTIPHTIEALQAAVAGRFEPFELIPILQRRGLLGLSNEDGDRLGYNPFSPLLGRELVGPVLVVHSRTTEFKSLTAADVAVLQTWLGRLVKLPL